MPDVVKGLSFRANYGEITAILGGNGTGKTTTLSLVAGLYEPYRGKITVGAQIYTLPQNPQTLFVAKTVREDLLEVFSGRKMAKAEKLRQLAAMVKLCRLDGLLDSHPYDLSGGEQQRAALAKVLLLQPKILLLDEPTKGLDAEFKQVFAAILRRLTDAGVAVVMASHDVEFCAEHADRCALFFDGDIVSENTPRAFFSGNSFYTTSANRMARGILPGAVTADDVILALGGTLPPAPALLDMDAKYDLTPVMQAPGPKPPGLSLPRRILVGLFGALLLAAVAVAAQNFDGFLTFISGGNEAVSIADEGAPLYAGVMLAFAAGVAGLAFTLAEKREDPPAPLRIAAADRKLSKRTLAAAVMILLAIPLTVYAGSYFFGDRKYYFISLLIILETMLPFALVFESRKPQARELVVIAVLCAIAVAGRAAFFMLPQFKPVVALVIIAGVAFGGEAGFLVGAMTGFVSNFFFVQGPWTPYQMFAFGAIGFLSGVLFRKGLLRRTPASLAVYGAFITFLVYGGIMNPASVMIYQNAPTGRMLLIAYLQGIPFDLVHAAATMTFLAVIARPMLEKLDRIKLKYGLISG
jgi:energy-coupling factor transport system ATP-binding protein